jgi:transposase
VNANQVFHWRKLYREGRLDVEAPAPPLVPVRLAEVVSEERLPARTCGGVILLEMSRARIRIEGSVDVEALRVVLERVSR